MVKRTVHTRKLFPLHWLMLSLVLLPAAARVHAQASALPPATDDESTNPGHGRQLLDEMVTALGGPAWLNRSTWVEWGQTGHFYKGQPDPDTIGFEDYFRATPFAERVVIITHMGNLAILGLPGRNHRDVAQLWTGGEGFELTYQGKKPLPKDQVAEYFLWRKHALDVIVKDWLKQPGVIVTYDGTDMDSSERTLADKVTISIMGGDAVTLALDTSTHLPVSLSFRSRNQTYQDFDTEREDFNDYHPIEGIMTPMTITRFKNGEMVSQSFLKKVEYHTPLPAGLFDADHPLPANAR